MNLKHQHCYTNYVNHILNNSPSKTSYTFKKGQRFQSPPKKYSENAPLDQILKIINPKQNRNSMTQLKQQSFKKNHMINYGSKVPFGQTNQRIITHTGRNNWMNAQNQLRKSLQKIHYSSQSSERSKFKNDKKSKSKSNINKSKSMKKLNCNQMIKSSGMNSTQQFLNQNKKTYNNNKSPQKVNKSSRSNKNNRNKSHKKVSSFNIQPPQRIVTQKSMQISSLNYNKSKKKLSPNKFIKIQQSPTKSHYKKVHSPQKNKKYINLEKNISSHSKHTDKYQKYSPYYKNDQYLNFAKSYPQQDQINYSKDKKNYIQKYQNHMQCQHFLNTIKRKTITPTEVLEQIGHPSKNVTCHGYYPIGVQIKQTGKYPISTYKNVITHSFGPPPPQKQNHGYLSPQKRTRSPYNYQTEGQKMHVFNRASVHNNCIASLLQKNKSDSKKYSYSDAMYQNHKINQFGSFHKHLFQKDKQTYLPRDKLFTQANYIPFSQFGNVKY